MKIAEISPRTLRKVDDQELLSLHHRLHQLWGVNFAGNTRETTGSLTREDLINAHAFIVEEMLKRKLKHHPNSELDKGLPEVKSTSDIILVPHFVSIVGSTVKDPESAQDLDVLVRSEIEGKKFYVSWENVFLPLRNTLDPGKEGILHIIANPQGPHGDYIPLYDLVLRPCPKEKISVKKAGELEIKFIGTGAMNSERRGASILISYGDIRIQIDGEKAEDIQENLDAILITDPEAWNAKAAVKAGGNVAPFEAGGLYIIPHEVKHTSHETYGYAIKVDHVFVAYAPEFFEFPEWAKEADLLIAEASSWKRPVKFKGNTGGHAAVLDTLEKAKTYGVKEVIFTHVGKETEEAIKNGSVEEARAVIASDGETLRIPVMAVKSVSPGSHYTLMKPSMAGYTEFFDTAELWEKWAQKKITQGKELLGSPKIDGFRTVISHNEGWHVFFEDAKTERRIDLPAYNGPSFVIEGEFTAKQNGKWLARTELAGVVAGKTEAEPFFWLYDLLYYDGQDVSEKPFGERLNLLRKLSLPESTFKVLEQRSVKSKEELASVGKWAASQEISEGLYIREADVPYAFGVTDTSAKIKTVFEIKVEVIEVIRRKNGLTYHCGLREPGEYTNVTEDGLLDLGNTFVCPDQHVSPGDTLNVHIEELVSGEKDGKPILFWGKPTVLGPDKSRPAYTVDQAINLAKRGHVFKEEIATKSLDESQDETRADVALREWQKNWWQVFPISGSGEFTYQFHFRGLNEEEVNLGLEELLQTDHSLHGDLRLSGREDLYGFTIFLGDISEVRQAGGDRLSTLKQNDALQGSWKLSQPPAWLTVARRSPYISAPGQAGSTSKRFAKFFEIDHGIYEIGCWREHFFEFFLHGSKLKGRFLIQYAPLGGRRVWIIAKPEDQTPYADTHKEEEIIAELRSKGQKYLVWGKPGTRPRLIKVGEVNE